MNHSGRGAGGGWEVGKQVAMLCSLILTFGYERFIREFLATPGAKVQEGVEVLDHPAGVFPSKHGELYARRAMRLVLLHSNKHRGAAVSREPSLSP